MAQKPPVKITRLKLSNFKSFVDAELRFGNINVIVGPNASGKSSLIQAFKFLQDVVKHNLDNAVGLQGGIEYLQNVKIGSSKKTRFEIDMEYGNPQPVMIALGKHDSPYMTTRLTYTFALQSSQESEFAVAEEKLLLHYSGRLASEKAERGEITVWREGDMVKVQQKLSGKNDHAVNDISVRLLARIGRIDLSRSLLFLQNSVAPMFFVHPLCFSLQDVKVFDIDPKLPKQPNPLTGMNELAGDGRNLSFMIKKILESADGRRKLLNLIQDLLPFITDMKVEELLDRSLLLSLTEKYAEGAKLPALLLSDGTMNVTALVVALFFDSSSIKIIEEPERGVHPVLLSGLTDFIEEASGRTQIFVTTHNPQVVQFFSLDSLYLLRRKEDGSSEVLRPARSEDVKSFIDNNVGIGDLFANDLIEA